MLSTESTPSLSFGKIHPSHLLLRRKPHESGSKAGSGLGQSQYCAEPVAGARIGSTSPGRATFTFQNARAVRKQECSSFSGARSSLCILACASVESGASQPLPQSPPSGHFVLGVVFAFPSQERAGETLPFVSRLLTDFPRSVLAICSYGKNKSCFCWRGPQLVVIGSFFPLFKM